MMSGDEFFGDEITSPQDPEAFSRERERFEVEDDFEQAEDRAVDEEGANEVRESWGHEDRFLERPEFPEHPDDLDDGRGDDRDPGTWICEVCEARNSRIDGECQFCDGPEEPAERFGADS